MFRVNPRVTLGLVFFTVLIQKSEKQWKVLRDCLENLPTGIPSSHQTFPRGCTPRESLISLGTSLGQIFPDNSCGFSTVCPTLQLLYVMDNQAGDAGQDVRPQLTSAGSGERQGAGRAEDAPFHMQSPGHHGLLA